MKKSRKNFRKVCLIFFLFILVYGFIFGEENYSNLKDKIDSLSAKLDNIDNIFNGLDIKLDLTSVFQGINNSNIVLDNNKKSPFYSSYSMKLEITKFLDSDEKNEFFMKIEAGEGSIDERVNLFSSANESINESDGNFGISEIYLKHKISNNFYINMGKLSYQDALDQNVLADDETTNFLSSLFVKSFAIDYPLDNSVGVQLFYEKNFFDFSMQYLNSNGENIDDLGTNMFFSFQFNIKPKLIDLNGNYRFYFWNNSSLYRTILDNEERNNNYGYGISFDQELSKFFSLFFRYGISDDKCYILDSDYKIDMAWSTGMILNKKIIDDSDFLGISYGEIKPNENFCISKEKHLEFFYNLHMSNFLSISPDFQYVKNPFGNYEEKDIFIYGIRTQINF